MDFSQQVRQQFFDFFKSKKHEIVPSSPIVLKEDPTLMFTNAGMNQFKDFFLGNTMPTTLRVANTQKCLRVKGKHNDLEEVGTDTYHHTMFEMLGNWSFGDYFKEQAIEYAWQLLTEIYNIPSEKIYVTYFSGNQADGLPADIETKNIWKKFIDESHILPFGAKENFWEMGDTGPCGPCSEIHVDCRNEADRKKLSGKVLVNTDNPNVIEIWNLVFIQFNRLKNKSLLELKQKHVDTGMGLERLVRVLENKNSNYDTDIFLNTIYEIEKITHNKYSFSQSYKDIAFRVIADHIRAIGFVIADGQLPSNTGAGYVIRRILRRAVRYYYSHLAYKEPLLYQLIPSIAIKYTYVFPELTAQKDLLFKIIVEEEQNFLKTLSLGLKKLDTYITPQTTIINGNVAFELYDTYGFPIDVTKIIANEKNIKVDEDNFEKAMLEQQTRSREATKIETFDWVIIDDKKNEHNNRCYETTELKTKVQQYRKANIKGKVWFQLVLQETPFYAESGGQIGDTGQLIFEDEVILVSNTKKENDLIIHFVEHLPSNIKNIVLAKVDSKKRFETSIHHSATHLLHAALQKILGNHVQQKGAFLCNTYLRFDFAHNEKIKSEELEQIEHIINHKIEENILIETKILPKEQAIALGAKALFGEKYGDMVRMVVIDKNFSIELCGGTHVENTSQIKHFKIIQESAVASGVRRIEAIAGKAYKDFLNNELSTLNAIKKIFTNKNNVLPNIENLIQKHKDEHSINESLKDFIISLLNKEIISKKENINGTWFLFYECTTPPKWTSPDFLERLIISIPSVIKDKFVACICYNHIANSQISIYVHESITQENNMDLNIWAKNNLAPLINGKGGGRKNFITYIGNKTDTESIKKIAKTLIA